MIPGVASAAPRTGAGTGLVTVIHGVPGVTVDVYVNGALTLPDFAPSTITGALELPEGNYDIEIFPANSDPSGTPIIAGSTFLPAGANASIIAHLTEAGAPTLSVFVNDLEDLARTKSRLVVRHTAAAPAVDVSLYRDRPAFYDKLVGVIPNLSNPNEVSLDVRPGKYFATLAPVGSPDPVFGPANLDLERRAVTIVYAIGSLTDGTFTLLVQTIDV
jgi:hypothetical protein